MREANELCMIKKTPKSERSLTWNSNFCAKFLIKGYELVNKAQQFDNKNIRKSSRVPKGNIPLAVKALIVM